jgi:hypothetical protein
MIQRRVFKWLTLDMVVFVAANAFLILCFGNKLSALNDIGYFKLLVFGLAVFRAANILSNETVTKPLRAPFVEESRKGGKIVQEPKKTGFIGAMGLLIYCPSCTGVWLATALVYFYVFYPAPTFVVALFLALSAVERIISAILERLKK